MTTDIDIALAANPPQPETARSTVTARKCRRHQWVEQAAAMGEPVESYCRRCGQPRDPIRSKRGRQSRNYGNRAELDVARRYGGGKVGHHGGPVDVRGTDFDTQVRTRRQKPPAEWKKAIGAMEAGGRCPRLLIRFVQPTGPEDYFIFRAADFLAWFGRDEETPDVG
jgi:hypothetical protein